MTAGSDVFWMIKEINRFAIVFLHGGSVYDVYRQKTPKMRGF